MWVWIEICSLSIGCIWTQCERNCCKEIVTTINNMLNEKNTRPVVMKWKEEDEKGKQGKEIPSAE